MQWDSTFALLYYFVWFDVSYPSLNGSLSHLEPNKFTYTPFQPLYCLYTPTTSNWLTTKSSKLGKKKKLKIASVSFQLHFWLLCLVQNRPCKMEVTKKLKKLLLLIYLATCTVVVLLFLWESFTSNKPLIGAQSLTDESALLKCFAFVPRYSFQVTAL